jgi:DNA-binding NtrC family response regulator
VTLDLERGISVLNAWGEIAELLRGGWVLERLQDFHAPMSSAPAFEVRGEVALAVAARPGGPPVALLARYRGGAGETEVLRLAVRFFAHEHSRAAASSLPERRPAELAFPPGTLVGRAAAMRHLYARIRGLTESNLPVVLLGETGTGKRSLARLLHDSGGRRGLPWVEVDLRSPAGGVAAALAPMSGRGRRKEARAAIGTLVLDGLDTLEPAGQSALIAALDELARDAAPGAPPRIVGITRAEPGAAAACGALRQDLWYRLAGAVVEVPPLRERAEDVPLLFDHFLVATAGPRRPAVSAEALRLLLAHDWPGNLRELRWEAERALAEKPGSQIEPRHLSSTVRDAATENEPATAELELATAFARVERRLIVAALQASRGNLSQAARRLGISRPRLRRRIAAFELARPEPRRAAGRTPAPADRSRHREAPSSEPA